MTPAELHQAILDEAQKSTDSNSMADINPLYADLLALAAHNQENNTHNPNPLEVKTRGAENQAKDQLEDLRAKQQQEIDSSLKQAQDQLADLKQAIGSQAYIDQADLVIVQDPETQLHHLVANGYLNLSSLTSAEGLSLPAKINGYLNLSSLTSAEGLSLPAKINGDLYLSSLTSTEGLSLPAEIGGGLDLGGLTSAEGLSLPAEIGGNLYLRSLTSVQKEQIKQQRPDLADKIY